MSRGGCVRKGVCPEGALYPLDHTHNTHTHTHTYTHELYPHTIISHGVEYIDMYLITNTSTSKCKKSI